MTFTKIAVLGLGKVGTLAASLLRDSGFEVTGFDAKARPALPFPTQAVGSRLAGRDRGGAGALPGRALLPALSPQHRGRQGGP